MKETREQIIKRWEDGRELVLGCVGCKPFYDWQGLPVDLYAPRHKASTRCESGKKPHCTCDRCF